MGRIPQAGPVWAIYRCELHQVRQCPRTIMLAPFLACGVALTVWLHGIAPLFAAAALTIFPAVELQFNNILYRSPKELEALGICPVPWTLVVRAKNLAAITIVVCIFVPVAIVLAYFSPSIAGWKDIGDLTCYLPTVLFPMLYIGNIQSLQNPRRNSGWQYEDLAEILWMTVTLALVSMPYMLLRSMNYGIVPILLYGFAWGWLWWNRSIPSTAAMIEKRFTEIIEGLYECN